ncbi:hypothetical protein GGI15_004501 [Coemansia interrupta]|uniref:RNA polymerase II-associated factor 1 homolog n=1 Tax=Coemansia interrupta TaxID=1126814 RepID=A0A9W8H5W2_9FUNG|nr:hypothetical protein GGI15_004501 [Coemansia interrupta]
MAGSKPPTKHANSNDNTGKKAVGKEFLCKVRYQNPLPEVPFPPKLLPVPPTYVDPSAGSYSQARLQHYVEYRHTTLEEATPYPMYVDADYGMPIDLCLLGVFDDDSAPMEQQQLDKEDEFLLNLPTSLESTTVSDNANAGGASGTQTPTVSAPTKPASSLHRSSVVGGAHKRIFDHTVEGQLRAIEDSFRYFNKYDESADGQQELLASLKHPKNNKLHAVESIPLFPNEHLWLNKYTMFSLDTRPEAEYVLEKERNGELTAEESLAEGNLARDSLLLRPRTQMNQLGENEQWIETFLPGSSEVARRVRRRLDEAGSFTQEDSGVTYRFEKSDEFDVPVHPATLTQDLYMITHDTEDGQTVARYVPIKTRMILKRRRIPLAVRQQQELEDSERITSINFQLRDFIKDEIKERAKATNSLYGIIKEEVIHASDASDGGDFDENVDIDDQDGNDDRMFSSDDGKNGRYSDSTRRHRRTPSYSSSSP